MNPLLNQSTKSKEKTKSVDMNNCEYHINNILEYYRKKCTTPTDSPSEIQQEESKSNIVNEIFSLPNTVLERPKGHNKDEKSKKSKTHNTDPKLRKKRKMSKSSKTKNEYYDAL